MRGNPDTHNTLQFQTKSKAVRPLTTQNSSSNTEVSKVIDFLPYLTAKQRFAAREATFMTLFLVFASLFFVLV